MSSLFVDSGALLFRQPVLSHTMLPVAKAQAEGIARAMAAMHVTAVGIAAQDLAAGPDFLLQLQKNAGLPFLSMNLRSDDGKPLFKPYLIHKADNLRIAILGLTGRFKKTNSSQSGYRILPWKKVLPATLAQAEKDADMVLLLSSFPEQVNEEIARTLQGIDIIVQAGSSASNLPPRRVAQALICQTGERGKYLGVMDIDWNSSGRWGRDTAAQRLIWQQRLNQINRQIDRLRGRDKDRPENRTYRQLLAARDDITAQLRELAAETQKETAGEVCAYSNRFIALKTSIPEDRQVGAIVEQTRRKTGQLNRKRVLELEKQRKGRQQLFKKLAVVTDWTSCNGCHAGEVRFWRQTGHARAWQTLARQHRQYDHQCLPCHLTLPAADQVRIPESMLPQLPARLHGVGCERCHGPGQKHIKDPRQNPMRMPEPSTCLACHQPEHDAAFTFSRKVEKIRCNRSGPLPSVSGQAGPNLQVPATIKHKNRIIRE